MRQALELQGFAGFGDGVTHYLSSLGKKKKERKEERKSQTECVTASLRHWRVLVQRMNSPIGDVPYR